MSATIQLDMFRETTESDVLKAELEALKESHHAVRKKSFAQLNALNKLVMDQQQEIDYLRMHLGLSCILETR